MAPANIKRYQLFLWKSTECFRKKPRDLFKKQHSVFFVYLK